MHNSTRQPGPTITIAIPAHNEEKNISRLIDSILAQDMNTFELKEILVLCDGCEDQTPVIAHEKLTASNCPFRISESKERIGKIGQLNQLYAICDSDIIVMFDADVMLAHTWVIKQLVAGFRDKTIGLVGGLEIPATPRTFAEKIFYTWSAMWYEVRNKINKGASVHNHAGCVSAVSKALYKNLTIPKEIIAEDEFLFFEAYAKGMKFAFVPQAEVYYNLPTTFREYVIQTTRYHETKEKIYAHFGPQTKDEYKVSYPRKIRALISVFIRWPLYTVLAICIQIFIRLGVYSHAQKESTHIWHVARTTK